MRAFAFILSLLLVSCSSVVQHNAAACAINAPEGLDSKNTDLGKVERVFQNGCRTIHLNSPGGVIDIWMKIAGLIRQYDITVIVDPGATCSSACTYALLASPRASVSERSMIQIHPTFTLYTIELRMDGISEPVRTYLRWPSPETDRMQMDYYRARGMPEAILSRLGQGQTITLTPEVFRSLGIEVLP